MRKVARLSRIAAATSLRRLFIRTTSDTKVGTGQGGRIVDAVPYHGYGSAFLQAADHRLLPIGKDARKHPINPGFRADGIRGALVVTGEHADLDAHFLQLSDRLGGIALQCVGNSDHAEQTLLLQEKQRCFTLSGEDIGCSGKRAIPLLQ